MGGLRYKEAGLAATALLLTDPALASVRTSVRARRSRGPCRERGLVLPVDRPGTSGCLGRHRGLARPPHNTARQPGVPRRRRSRRRGLRPAVSEWARVVARTACRGLRRPRVWFGSVRSSVVCFSRVLPYACPRSGVHEGGGVAARVPVVVDRVGRGSRGGSGGRKGAVEGGEGCRVAVRRDPWPAALLRPCVRRGRRGCQDRTRCGWFSGACSVASRRGVVRTCGRENRTAPGPWPPCGAGGAGCGWETGEVGWTAGQRAWGKIRPSSSPRRSCRSGRCSPAPSGRWPGRSSPWRPRGPSGCR